MEELAVEKLKPTGRFGNKKIEHVYYNENNKNFFILLAERSSSICHRMTIHIQKQVRDMLNFMEEWDDVVRLSEDDVFVNYRWNSDSDDILIPLYDPMFELLKEHSEEIVLH